MSYLLAALFLGAAVAGTAAPGARDASPPADTSLWTAPRLAELRKWVAAAPEDALPSPDTRALDAALASGDPIAVARAADAVALRLARMHLAGCCTGADRAVWHIVDTDPVATLPAQLTAALAGAGLDPFFSSLRPQDPEYAALRSAYAKEQDPSRRATLAHNIERWRWLPRDLGRTHLLVNAASFEVRYWRDGALVGRWPVVVGKVKSPTPIFSARVTGVTFNPWWEIPPNIVGEGIGKLARTNPALAHARGYEWSGGRFRQRPGPNNSLGQMKLVMPNRFNVYLHDTPSKALFARPVRAFSHGCVRVGDALAFAGALLEGAAPSDEIAQIVASGRTRTLALPAPIPVYVTYFTAGVGPDGAVVFYPDVYGRDRGSGHAFDPATECSAGR